MSASDTIFEFLPQTLASKLNGGNPSKENAPSSNALNNSNSSNSSNSSSKLGQGKTTTQTGSSAPLPAGQGSHSSATSGLGGQIASRPTNPFANRFSGLRNEHNSYGQSPANQSNKTTPTNNLSRTSAASAPTGVSYQSKSTVSRKEPHTSPTKVKTPVTAAPSESAEGDLSFGADDFLIGSDELALADLMDDLDGDKDNEESSSLSWTPTPPKTTEAKPQGTTSNPFTKPGSTVASGSYNAKSAPSSQVSTVAPQLAARTFVRSTPSKPDNSASESSDRGIIMVPNSQEDTSTRPNERDTIDHRSAQRAQDIKEQDRKGLLRTQSSPSTGFASKASPNRNRRRLPGPAGNLPRLVCLPLLTLEYISYFC